MNGFDSEVNFQIQTLFFITNNNRRHAFLIMMVLFFNVIILLIAVLFAIPLWVLATECLIAFLRRSDMETTLTPSAPTQSYRILIPAHNEAPIIGQTLPKLIVELPDSNSKCIVLVADNCSDNTAEIARTLGVTVLERQDNVRRGKGFALQFGLQKIKESGAPEILIIIDADCETTKESLCTLICTVESSGLPAQMIYQMRTVKNAGTNQKVAGFAWLLKNRIRPLALDTLKLPAALSGTGMGFPWQIIQYLDMGSSSIVENMDLTLDCILKGYPPSFCPNAFIYSDFPLHAAAETIQRTRWEHGHLLSIIQQFPVLLSAAWRQKNWRLLLLALDLSVPPLSLMVVMALSAILILYFLAPWTGSKAPSFFLLSSFAYFAFAISVVWYRYGRVNLTLSELFSIPLYILNKMPIYFSFLFKRQKEWIRTNRNA